MANARANLGERTTRGFETLMPGFQPSFLRHLAPIMPDPRRALCPVSRGVITGIRPYARYHGRLLRVGNIVF